MNLKRKISGRSRAVFNISAIAILFCIIQFQTASAASAPSLGTAVSFAVLGGSTATNTGATVINGSLGVSPGTAITGFPPGVVIPPATIHANDAVSLQAQNDANTAYGTLASEACNAVLTGQDLGGLTLTPGVYCFASSAQLTGALTLNAQGDPGAVFIFQIGSALTTASNASVNIINGGSACNVFFQVGSSATLGTGTAFLGNILALTSITLNTGASVAGRVLAHNGAVTMDTNAISVPTCSMTPTTGSLQVCKVAGAGIVLGTNFDFNVAGTPVTVPAGAAPGGNCGAPVTVPAGAAIVAETIPPNTALAGVSTLPTAGLLVSSNLGAGTATVTVIAGGQTIVTFIDAAVPIPPMMGFVQVCKVAGSGVAPGTSFNFDVAGTPVTVPAGVAPGGTCGTPVMVAAGSAAITETIPPNTLLAGVSTLPTGLLVSSNLAAGTATVTVSAGGQTIVTFIDAAIPMVPTTGFVQVCKIAGTGVAVGTNLTFNVAGTPVVVSAGAAPGGACGAAVNLPAGPALITETLPANTQLTGVGTLPSAGLLVNSNLAAGTATVTVVAGGQTIVTFIDAVIPVVPPPTGFVQVCKVAGAGIAAGTNFTFNVAGTPVVVPAGAAPGGNCGAPVTLPAGSAAITETIPANTVLAGVSTLPTAGLLVNSDLGAGTATVMVIAGGQTIVTFIDAATPIPPMMGFVQVCKVAGLGVATGTNFNFNVAGTPVTIPAGSAPGGTCGTPLTVPAGTAVITETIPANTLLAGVTTLPSGLLVSSNLGAGTATVTVVAGGQTIVTFIDAAMPIAPATGFIQVCKVAGAGVAVGTNFLFNVAGTAVTIPAGASPGGTCASPITLPAGPTSIAETIPVGVLLAGVSTLPDAGLLVSSNLGAGTATVTVIAGAQTIVTFIDAAPPAPPVLGKSFSTLGADGATVLTFTLLNPNAAVALSGVSFNDALPAGLALSVPNGLPNGTCMGSINTAGNTIVAAGIALAPASSCTFSVNVTAILAGSYLNTTSVISTNLLTTPGSGLAAVAALMVSPPADSFQINYLSNAAAGGGVDISNAGSLGASRFGPQSGTTGNICANVYVFGADEEEVSCCSCLVTPNALVHLGAADLAGNPANGVQPGSVSVQLLFTIPGTASGIPGTQAGPFTGSSCNAAYPFNVTNLAPGGRAWATKFHSPTSPPSSFTPTETEFTSSPITLGTIAQNAISQITMATNLCQLISGNQSGAGVCKTCSLGSIGAAKQ